MNRSDRVGILAGRGSYPGLLARSLHSRGIDVIVAGMVGQYNGVNLPGSISTRCFPIGAVGHTAHYFREGGARTVFMAGGVRRKGVWRHVRPDLVGLSLLPKAVWGGDDRLLRLVATAFEKRGVCVGDPSPYLEEQLAPEGHFAGPPLDTSLHPDLELAWRAAAEIGGADAGQAAVVFKGRVVGHEGRGGTDDLLTRSPGPGAVLAKVVKPGQDRRFDMPALGPSTAIIAGMVGVKAIVVEAGGVLLLEKERFAAVCGRVGVSVVGSQNGVIDV